MKSLVLFALFGGTLAAQAPQEPKIPREPDLGNAAKVTPVLERKAAGPIEAAALPQPASASDLADKAAVGAAAHGIRKALADADAVAFDQPQAGGPLWAMGSDFKAVFERDGWSFIAQPATSASPSEPIRFHASSATVGGRPLGTEAVQPTRQDRRIAYAHRDFVETLEVSGRGVEQTFTFRTLPQRGELVVSIDVTTTLTGQDLGHGLAFRSESSQLSYGEAVAIDAAGERVVAATTLVDGRIILRVPAAFVEHAALPLVIDPLVTSTTAHGDTVDLAEPDVAWDESNLEWAVVYQRQFSATDWDMFVQRLDANLGAIGTPVTIDFTGDRWQRGRIANLGAYDLFGVVAEVRSGTNPVKVAARLMDGAGITTTTQFDVANAPVDSINPDIGGDPASGPTYFTVVWEHCYSATDHDIYARQITDAGVLRGTGTTIVQGNTTNQTRPSISKSDGAAPFSTQRFTIVYQQTFSPTDEDIYGAMLTWDGQFVPVFGNNTFSINASGATDVWPKVSSPSLGASSSGRSILVVHQRPNTNNSDVVATCIDADGNYLDSVDVNVLENNATRLNWPQYLPNVDCDGGRFAVVYHEQYNGTGTDLDTRATLLALVNGSLVAQESAVTLAYSGNPEFNVSIASRYSGSAQFDTRYCTVNDRDGGATPFAIDAYTYDGYGAGGYNTRPTGCGGLTLTPTGEPILGRQINMSAGPVTGLVGMMVGFPVAVPLGACPGCTIGVNGVNVLGSSLSLNVPLNPALAGATFSFQAFQFAASGVCLGQIDLSDTVDATLR